MVKIRIFQLGLVVLCVERKNPEKPPPHRSPISSPSTAPDLSALNPVFISGSVILSNNSCESVELVESMSAPFGLGCGTSHPATL